MTKITDGACGCDRVPDWIEKIESAETNASEANATATAAASQVEAATTAAAAATTAAQKATAAAQAVSSSLTEIQTEVTALTREIPNDVGLVSDGNGYAHPTLTHEDETMITGASTQLIQAGANVTFQTASNGATIINSTGGGEGGSYVAGTGITISGSTISVDDSYVLTEGTTGLEASLDTESSDALISLSVNGTLDSVGIRPGDGVAITLPAANILRIAVTGYVPIADYNTAITQMQTDINAKASTVALTEGLAEKQDTLTAGEGITISEMNVISASGGGSGDTWTRVTNTNIATLLAKTDWSIGDRIIGYSIGPSTGVNQLRSFAMDYVYSSGDSHYFATKGSLRTSSSDDNTRAIVNYAYINAAAGALYVYYNSSLTAVTRQQITETTNISSVYTNVSLT